MAGSWSKAEVEATVADYFSMLFAEIRGEAYNKAAHRRALVNLLDQRSEGAVERKHQNISAILIEIGYAYISGYKPLGNYQSILKDVVLERIAENTSLEQAIEAHVSADAVLLEPDNILDSLVQPPVVQSNPSLSLNDVPRRLPPVLGKNYLAMEAQNRSLGLAGEDFVVKFEQARLLAAGKENLAADVEHVSKTKGDGLGYDILSFDETGRERLIEAKTTAYGASTPFFVTRRELEVSVEASEKYHIYRLFQFRKKPLLFVRTGSIDTAFQLTPALFSAVPR